jgi:hypothetical protein
LGRISSAGLLGAADPHFPFATVQCVASALLVIFNAAIAVWPMVALNVTLTAINVFYIVQLLRGRHDSRTFEVVQRDVSAYPRVVHLGLRTLGWVRCRTVG